MGSLPRYLGSVQQGDDGMITLYHEPAFGEPTERDWAEYMAWLDSNGGWPSDERGAEGGEWGDEDSLNSPLPTPHTPLDREPSEADRREWAALSAELEGSER